MARNNVTIEDNRSSPELLRDLTDQVTTLLRKEVELAKVEMTEKAKEAGTGLGMLGAGGVVALLSLGALTTALIAALATGMDLWLAALIVGAVYALIAGGIALAGRQRVEHAGPMKPEKAIESTEEDIRWAKTQARSAKR